MDRGDYLSVLQYYAGRNLKKADRDYRISSMQAQASCDVTQDADAIHTFFTGGFRCGCGQGKCMYHAIVSRHRNERNSNLLATQGVKRAAYGDHHFGLLYLCMHRTQSFNQDKNFISQAFGTSLQYQDTQRIS